MKILIAGGGWFRRKWLSKRVIEKRALGNSFRFDCAKSCGKFK